MPAERRWDQREYRIVESASHNNNARTVIIETTTPGTSVPPHYHSRFSETFELINGSVSVHTGPADTSELAFKSTLTPLEPGKPMTVPLGWYHQFIVGNETSTFKCTLEPGDIGFENMLKVLDGLKRDGEFDQLEEDDVFLAVLMDLTDAHPLWKDGEMLINVRKERSEAIEQMKEDLLKKYDTPEALARLMAD